jgi:hypothetical protein
MKVTASADWRDSLAFETPVILADVIPGEPTRCSVCGPESSVRDRTDLWAIKHRHPRHHDGFVRFYCVEHRPAPPRAAPRPEPVREKRVPQRRAAASVDAPVRAMCPDCFVEVSATGLCGVCGTQL